MVIKLAIALASWIGYIYNVYLKSVSPDQTISKANLFKILWFVIAKKKNPNEK